ncbi:NACHT domain-containing protein [Trichocoleus sp. ST-U3]
MKLDSSTINELVKLLRPYMEDERDRRPFLVLALGNDAPVLQHITWSGAVAAFIPDMVCKLADYGEVAPGRQALWALLDYVRSQAGIDVQQRIDKLRPLIDLPAHSDAAIDTTSDLDVLVQKVRSCLYDNIQSLHGTMPLWSVDRWVPLGELFVDVNILEELSSSRRSELDELWQDFSKNPSYRSLDRIGLGKERERVSGLDVLAKNTNLMVVGKPGSGKTTYLQRVVTECNAENLQAYRIPVLIKLRDFIDDGRKVAYSLKRYLERYWRLSDTETQLILDKGRALVLLDGLDEVTGEDGKNIAKEIKRFARAYPQVQVIVTCRTQSFTGEMDWKSLRFQFVEVADFDELQVRTFAEHWFKTVMGDESAGLAKAQEFLEQLFLEENKPIRELAITPILLSLTCAVFHQTGKFYSKRSKLYEEGLELLLEQWDERRGIERDEIYRDLSVERKLELLSYLAVKRFEQPQYVLFEQAEVEGYIAEFLPIGQRDSRVVLRAIESQHGLLIERSQKVWSFSHLTFQEYLVAKWLVKCIARLSIVNYPLERWQEVFRLALETFDAPEELFLFLKEHFDTTLIADKKIKDFMEWVNQKSNSVNSKYTQTAIRTFYFGLASGLDNFIGCSFNKGIIREINNDIFRGVIEDSSLELDRALVGLLETLIDSYRISRYLVKSNSNHFNYVGDLIKGNISIDDCELEFKQKIKELITKLYSLINDLETPEKWHIINNEFWIDELKENIIQCRNIGHSWNFTQEQIETIRNYFYANVFYVNNLRESHCISNSFRESFPEDLFLVNSSTAATLIN